MSLTFSIDWLNMTAHDLGLRTLSEVPYPSAAKTYEPAQPGRGYNRGLVNDLGARISWHATRAEQGVHVQYSGSCLNKYSEQGTTAQMIAMHHYLSRDTCTRVDLALDTHDERLNIARLHQLLLDQNGRFSFEHYSHITSQNGGETLYLGSRSSEQMIRIYNKAVEQQQEGDWVRVELECKGSRAKELGMRLALESVGNMTVLTRGIIAGMAMFDDSTWKGVVGDLVISLAKAASKEPDTKGWLLAAVAPAMGRYIRESKDNEIVDRFLAVVAAYAGSLDT